MQKWTDAETAVLRSLWGTMSERAVAREMGRDWKTVRRAAGKVGLAPALERKEGTLHCETPGCDQMQPAKRQRGLCNRCYSRWRRTGKVDAPVKVAKPPKTSKTKPTADGRVKITPFAAARLKEMWFAGDRTETIAEELSVTPLTVRKNVRKLELDNRHRRGPMVAPRWSRDDDRELEDLWKAGLTTREIAEETGWTQYRLAQRGRWLGLPPAPRARGIEEKFEPVAFEDLANKVVKPGIEKHLVPLLHFRGDADLGRVHRLWNLTIALKETEIGSLTDAVKLVNHSQFAHLCEPIKKKGVLSLQSFFSRLEAKPLVAALEPGMLEYVRSLGGFRFDLTPVSEIAHHSSHAWWRNYQPRRLSPEEAARRAAERLRPRATELMWPYVAHDPKKTDVGGTDIVALVNSIVSKNIPEENRADICQDLILAVLEGKYSVDDIRDNPKKYISAVRDTSPWKYEWVSMDAPLFGDGRALHEVIAG